MSHGVVMGLRALADEIDRADQEGRSQELRAAQGERLAQPMAQVERPQWLDNAMCLLWRHRHVIVRALRLWAQQEAAGR